jgi:hypothetical protein
MQYAWIFSPAEANLDLSFGLGRAQRQDSSIPAYAWSKLVRSLEQSKRDVFITVIRNIFTISYGPSVKCKALYSVNCILVSINNFYTFALLNVLNWVRTNYFTQRGYGLRGGMHSLKV